MYIDALLKVSDAQALTATASSTSSIDLGNVTPKRAIGTGEPMGFGVSVGVAADFTTGDETYEIDLITSASADLSTPTTLSKQSLLATQLVAGASFFVPIPQGAALLRHIGLRYILAGTTPSVTLSAWLTSHALFSIAAQKYAKSYPV